MAQSQKRNDEAEPAGCNPETAPGVRAQLAAWFARPPGSLLAQLERQTMDRLLPRMFGYHIGQIGSIGAEPYYRHSPISHQLLLQVEEEENDAASLRCRTDALPIRAESMDVVILPHTLEFTEMPHRLLRECERILIGEGHLIIMVFNPWSLCGLWRLFLAWRDVPPWNGHFYRHARIKDWLSLLDLELIHSERVFYRPPLRQVSIMRRLGFLEKLGRYCWPYFGGVHIMVARKRVVPLTPLKVSWRSRRRMITSGVAEPTARM